MAAVPSLMRPRPTALHGLSPDQAKIRPAGLRPNLFGEIGAHRAEIGGGFGEGRQFAFEAGGGGVESARGPSLFSDVHEIHAGAVAVINGGDSAGENGGHEGTDEAMEAVRA